MTVGLANDKDSLTTRVAHSLGLTGPSYSVQSYCSTSLVAVHLACQAILAGECDMALAGAATVRVPQHVGYLSRQGDIYRAGDFKVAWFKDPAGNILSIQNRPPTASHS